MSPQEKGNVTAGGEMAPRRIRCIFTAAVFRYRSCHAACSVPFARFWFGIAFFMPKMYVNCLNMNRISCIPGVNDGHTV
jgi:hypothetical protein